MAACNRVVYHLLNLASLDSSEHVGGSPAGKCYGDFEHIVGGRAGVGNDRADNGGGYTLAVGLAGAEPIHEVAGPLIDRSYVARHRVASGMAKLEGRACACNVSDSRSRPRRIRAKKVF